MYPPNLKSVALPVPEIRIVIHVIIVSLVANPQSRGKGRPNGVGIVPFERALVSSYRPSMVTFPRE